MFTHYFKFALYLVILTVSIKYLIGYLAGLPEAQDKTKSLLIIALLLVLALGSLYLTANFASEYMFPHHKFFVK